MIESKLHQLSFSRQKLGYCYFSAAATPFSPELADARLSWAKNGVLTTVVDDFFDVGSSEEEQLNLIQLVDKWDGNLSIGSCSEKVAIIFSALQSTICELGEKAYASQNHNITEHIVEIVNVERGRDGKEQFRAHNGRVHGKWMCRLPWDQLFCLLCISLAPTLQNKLLTTEPECTFNF